MITYLLFSALLFQAIKAQGLNRTVPLIVTYKNDTLLYCGDNTSTVPWPNVSFYQMTDSNLSTSKQVVPGDKKYILNINTSTLLIKSIVKPDILSQFFCNSTNGITIFYRFQITPFMYVLDKTKISPMETSDAELSCALLYGNEDKTNNITWKWWFAGAEVLPSDRFIITNTFNPYPQSRLVIREVKMIEKGLYECRAYNSYGTVAQSVLINVKSTLTPLWPFIGVFAEILVFICILKTFAKEKKHRS